jgi:hypothetical protein
MKVNHLCGVVLCCLLAACSKDDGGSGNANGTTTYTADLLNTTTVAIEVKSYKGGAVAASDRLQLVASTGRIEIANASRPGISPAGTGFTAALFQNADSVIVTFNNANSITHYARTTINLARKYYLPSSNRNLFNVASYRENITDATGTRSMSYLYFFAPQDYADAQ